MDSTKKEVEDSTPLLQNLVHPVSADAPGNTSLKQPRLIPLLTGTISGKRRGWANLQWVRKRQEYQTSEKEKCNSKQERRKRRNWEGLQYVRKSSREKEHEVVEHETDGLAYRGKPQLQQLLPFLPLLLVNLRKDSHSIQPPRYIRSSPERNRTNRRAVEVPTWEYRELVLPERPDGRIDW